MSSNFEFTNAMPWTGMPGLYAIFNFDGRTVLDETCEAEQQVIHGWEHDISKVNQLWQLADIGDKKWLVIKKKTGHYLAAKDDGISVGPQTGDADSNSAHWRITKAEAGNMYKLYIYSVKFNGNRLTLANGNGDDGTEINCATHRVRPGQVWVVKKQN